MARKKTLSFEASISTLEDLIANMDSGELSLEESLESFERGINLIRECQSSLDSAEQKVQQLMEVNGLLETESLDQDDHRHDDSDA